MSRFVPDEATFYPLPRKKMRLSMPPGFVQQGPFAATMGPV